MADNFQTLSNRLLSRCPAVGIALAEQLVNDAWHQFQARREWSFRRRSGTFAPPAVYQSGTVSTNVSTGNQATITGSGTTWTPFMVGRQIRIGGPLYPYYTITQYLSPTSLVLDQPWYGPDVSGQQYQILQAYYQVPAEFNYFHVVVSTQNSKRLWTNVTQNELGVLDPQRTNQGSAFATAFRDFSPNYGGVIGPVTPVTSPTDPAPVSATTFGYSYPANASYVVQVVSGGISGVATFQWLRVGQASFQPTITTASSAQDLSDGVQVYWPDSQNYVTGDLFVINCQAQTTQGVPRYELWPTPTPTTPGALYPFVFIAKEYDLTALNPQLPPFVANRGDVILEMALASCARFPGSDTGHPNVYFNLDLAGTHEARAEKFIAEMEKSDDEVSVQNRNYDTYPMEPSPWTVRPRPTAISGTTGGDDFNTLSNRLLDRCPGVGIQLAEQFVNDAWHTLQAKRDWSWRRKSGTFAPPTLYQDGLVSTNVSIGSPYLITGIGTAWTSDMVGRQIRAGGLLYPYYTITGYLSPTSILIDQSWAGTDITNQAYQILQVYFPMPADFGYFEVITSIKDSFRLYHQLTQEELALIDPQRTNQGQTYAVAYRDFSTILGGIVSPCIPVTSTVNPAPFSITTTGYTYPASATYIVQVLTGGPTGTATFQWIRAGQNAFSLPTITFPTAQNLADGVQVYWPIGVNYVSGDIFFINAQSILTQGVARYELWPAPTFAAYLYPYVYFTKETDLTAQNPILPPSVANRGELLLEMALEKCATFPGLDLEHPNIYYSLQLASYHRKSYEDSLIEFVNNDQNVGITNLDYEGLPWGGPFETGSWMQRHSPLLY